MGAGQIGGIATMLDIDFLNAPGFIGSQAENIEGNYMVYFLSHAVLFCVGALIEAHVVLTPAICVDGWKYQFKVYGGSHRFLEGAGISRPVENICVHKAYNRTTFENNIALLVLKKQFSLRQRDPNADFTINRLRYGRASNAPPDLSKGMWCEFFGWGSRRNGFLVPLLIHSRKVRMKLLEADHCDRMWNYNGSYLCFENPPCRNDKYGALCPDDIGSVMACNGYAYGLMVSRLADRPCGIGYLDIAPYTKFLTCGVDDADDVYEADLNYYDLLNTVAEPEASQATTVTVSVPVEETVAFEDTAGPIVELIENHEETKTRKEERKNDETV